MYRLQCSCLVIVAMVFSVVARVTAVIAGALPSSC